MTGLVSRALDAATAAERGDDDLAFGEHEAPDVPEELCHQIDRQDDRDAPPVDRCRHCGRVGSIGSINPFERCRARELPTAVESRAKAIEKDDAQTALGGQA